MSCYWVEFHIPTDGASDLDELLGRLLHEARQHSKVYEANFSGSADETTVQARFHIGVASAEAAATICKQLFLKPLAAYGTKHGMPELKTCVYLEKCEPPEYHWRPSRGSKKLAQEPRYDTRETNERQHYSQGGRQ